MRLCGFSFTHPPIHSSASRLLRNSLCFAWSMSIICSKLPDFVVFSPLFGVFGIFFGLLGCFCWFTPWDPAFAPDGQAISWWTIHDSLLPSDLTCSAWFPPKPSLCSTFNTQYSIFIIQLTILPISCQNTSKIRIFTQDWPWYVTCVSWLVSS